jgi:carbon-monoxide dehydrogenase medium subunit
VATDRGGGEVKAPAFDYVQVASVKEAVAAFRACEGEARYLAGGQSLLVALNLRLSAPSLLIDIGRIDALRGIELRDGTVRIGALTRHAEVLSSDIIARHVPLLSLAAPFVAHPAIRNKGTFGGSLALADPASEFPAVALALGARMEIADAETTRLVAADDYFLDLYETALAPGEVLTAVHVPAARPTQAFAFDELARRRGDYAMIGIAIAADGQQGHIDDIRIAFCAAGPTPRRARAAEAALAGRDLTEAAVAAAQAALSEDLAPDDDVHTSAATRMHLARVLLGRQLAKIRAALTSDEVKPS